MFPLLPAEELLSKMTRKAYGWTIALIVSLVLNFSLFGLMPGLIQQVPSSPNELEPLQNIQVFRVKKTETPPRRKKPVKKTKPEKILKAAQRPAQIMPKQTLVKPKLDFELNPKLPTASTGLTMPPLEHFALDGPALNGVYDLKDLDAGLIALVRIPPIYPTRAKRKGIEGFVTIEFQVTKQGLVDHIKVVTAKPGTIFNKSVIACVSRWKFKPPTIEGIPVAALARTTINFKLEE